MSNACGCRWNDFIIPTTDFVPFIVLYSTVHVLSFLRTSAPFFKICARFVFFLKLKTFSSNRKNFLNLHFLLKSLTGEVSLRETSSLNICFIIIDSINTHLLYSNSHCTGYDHNHWMSGSVVNLLFYNTHSMIMIPGTMTVTVQ